MKIYIAAGLDRKDEMRLLAGQIEGWTKHTVVSRWHGRAGVADWDKNAKESDLALWDVDDIKSADILLSVGGLSTKYARFVEFGMAWAWNLRIIHLGEHENLFHTLPGITHVPNRGALMDVLREKFTTEDALDTSLEELVR